MLWAPPGVCSRSQGSFCLLRTRLFARYSKPENLYRNLLETGAEPEQDEAAPDEQ